MTKALIAVVIAGAMLAACETAYDGSSSEAASTHAAPIGSGKVDVTIADVPEAVLAAARATRPTMAFTGAEVETRLGLTYYDVGGELPNGAEIELDIMQEGDGWQVVEIQRDMTFADTPQSVRDIMAAEHGTFVPTRVVESDQDTGIIIYELFGPDANGEEIKIEVKHEDGAVEVLTEEWVH